ncbi:sensor histidine kinase [Brevibacterium sp. UCMA 11752]|uniref:sensor histidine kinase n=1 Tax=Brevibacterium sp. UCMA 11752 TaxID=2745946 RepID=UPI001F401645|nr:HAMP domain-containing sensor histidine kinase [Brevibacterium sp. UCMA 11752]MCF2588886.1 HAMP domain-containing histidine kinase [Brevibacterium sp. UCMA 11752]
MSDLDSQLAGMTHHARVDPGPGQKPGDRPTSNETDSSTSVDKALRYLFQPGVGDGALVVVGTNDSGEGLIAEAGRTQPQTLPVGAVDVLLDVDAVSGGEEPGPKTASTASGHRSVDVPGYGTYRVAAFDDKGTTTVYGVPQNSVDSALERTAYTTALAVLIGVLATALLMAVIIHRQLRDLRDVARTAREVTDLELGEGEPELALRVPSDLAMPGTEVGDVGASVNRMLDHVGSALDERYRGTEQMRQFVADASHELRTPIATIRGWADLTRPYRDELPAQVQTSLGKIDSGAMRMSTLVDDLLLLARLEAGRQPTKENTVDVSALLLELVEDAHVLSPEHEIRLDLPPDALEIRGADDQARQAVAIVLTNACVHTPAGTRVHVEAELGEESDAEETVIVRISDNGPGVPEEIRDTVFDRFVRGDAARTRAEGVRGGSSGLGLAIAAGLVELMHGTVSMTTSDAGTVFELRFWAA